jgi:hypothetical protein
MDILTANELMSGATVYLDAAGRWVEDLQQARLFGPEDKETREDCIARSKATHRIVGIEVETVSVTDGKIVPHRIREAIRAAGPTAPRFDRQHLDEDGHVSI